MLKALGDPYVVAKFQQTFGLRRVDEKDDLSKMRDQNDSSSLGNGHVSDGYSTHNNHLLTNGSNLYHFAYILGNRKNYLEQTF